MNTISRELLEALAALAPVDSVKAVHTSTTKGISAAVPNTQAIDELEAWLKKNGLVYKPPRIDDKSRTLFELHACPFDPTHVGGDAALGVMPSGATFFHCFHAHCAQRNWKDIRDLFGPVKTKGTGKDKTATDNGGERSPVLVCFADVKEVPVTFLWKPFLPVGKLCFLEGDPSVGKTYLACKIAATVSKGLTFYGDEPLMPPVPRNVIYMTAEDGLGDTLVPRLRLCDADLSRVHTIQGIKSAKGEVLSISLQDVDVLEAAFSALNPALIIIDPIQGYLGAKIDLHRANEVRPVLARIMHLAEKYSCAVLGIRHLNKSAGPKALYRGLGSIDLAAAARSMILVGEEPKTGRRVLVHVKSSLAPKGLPLAYRIDDVGITWLGTCDMTEEELLGARPVKDDEDKSSLEEAKMFILAKLTDGPVPADEMIRDAKKNGISERTLRRAKFEVKARSGKSKPSKPTSGGQTDGSKPNSDGEADGRWFWYFLPGDKVDDQNSKTDTDGGTGFEAEPEIEY